MGIYSKLAPKNVGVTQVWQAVTGSAVQVFVRFRDSRGDVQTIGPLRTGWHNKQAPPDKDEGDVLFKDWEGNWLRLYFSISDILPFNAQIAEQAVLFVDDEETPS